MSTATLNATGFGTSSFAPSTRPQLQQQRSHLKMTARGRAVVLGLVATPLVLVGLAMGINAGGATATSSSTPLQTVTVTSGETLWQVARHLAPNADPRDVIIDIMNVNNLKSADIVPGEELKIPAQYND